jgi:geranylgeranyl diphosphate synthase, type II
MNAQQSQSLNDFLVQSQKRVNQSLETILSLTDQNNNLLEAMRYACLDGGKRIRPVLVYASTEAVGANIELADAPACAVELIHSYSLVHDDLPAMDDDDLRRGKPSVHKAYDEATAILVGDAVQALAFQCLSDQGTELSAATKLKMTSVLSSAAGVAGMTGGQALDLAASGTAIELSNLETMHRLKTGALIRASVRLGALCNEGITDEQQQALDLYAENIGLAFQVQDDILDEIGDTKTLGKPQGSDRAQSKSTYVSLLGLDPAKERATELAENAVRALEGFSSTANSLRDIATYIVSRIH